ncbi:MAG: aminopeptidase [Desulfobulbaceae bacterium]|nr:aminopeptidase [Desulfobulbaceae bacterium]
MIPMIDSRLTSTAVLVICIASISGCYYAQAARGQLEIMRKREPITAVIADAGTSTELADRLRLVEEARSFSVIELGLPDNDSYRSYADVERDYAVWNVFAAPEFSLEAKQSCFPVVGCVSYRGYFSEHAARREAARLRNRGFDVSVGGIAAYSTLGKFDDPVLNTMMQWDDTDLVATMFHELAHQLLYVKGDSAFNESFATAVEEFGIERWLASRGLDAEMAEYLESRELRQRLMQFIEAARVDLAETYATPLDVNTKRSMKSARLDTLKTEVMREFEASGRRVPAWIDEGLNNARLASMVLYQGRLPEFRELLAECDDDIRCFYVAARDNLANL